MKVEFIEKDITKLLSQRNATLMITGVMAVSNMILLSAYVMKGERTILLPPQVIKPLWVEGGDVSKEYLEEWALYVSTLLLDMSPASAAFKHKALLKYTAPESYSRLKKTFLKDEEHYTSLQLATSFRATEVHVNPKTLEAEVTGELTSFVSTNKVETKIHRLKLKFAMRGAGILLESIQGGLSDAP